MSHDLRDTRGSVSVGRGPDAQPALGPGKQTRVEQIQRRATGDAPAPAATAIARPPRPQPSGGDLLQRVAGRPEPSGGDGPREGGPLVDAALASPSQPLDEDVRSTMESKLKQDFSGVRIHTNETAAAGAASVQAKAFTVGRDIVFGSGQYQPHSAEGRQLLAHELTHVVQQGGGRAAEVARAPAAPGADQAPAVELRSILRHIEQLYAAAAGLPDLPPDLASAAAELSKLRAVADGSDAAAIAETLETLKQKLSEAGAPPEALQQSAAKARAAHSDGGATAAPAAVGAAATVQTPERLAAKPLAVSQPGDAAEAEADHVADAVMSDRPVAIGHSADPAIHRVPGALTIIALTATVMAVAGSAASLHHRFIAAPRAARVAEANAQTAAVALETSDSAANPHAGHSLGRHGPHVTDAQLQSRLTTGVAPDGAFSPAPGVSSRFNSHVEYIATRQAAVTQVQTAIATTQALLAPLLTAYDTACVAFFSAVGAARGALAGPKTVAFQALTGAVAGITNPDTVHIPLARPNNFQVPNGTPATNVPALVTAGIAAMMRLRPTYKVIVNHGRDIGAAFTGTGAPTAAINPATGAAGAGQTWPATAPAAAAPQLTRTTLEVPVVGAPLNAAPAPATWTAIQHFPAENTAPVGIGY
jgi:hypothetical protein